MGIVRSAVRRPAARASSGPLSGVATPEKWVVDWVNGGTQNSSGVWVTEETALHYSPFFAGVRVISEDLGGLPLFLYERLARGKRRATSHPLYRLLHDQPNPMMSSVQLRETLEGHAMTWGNGVAQLVTNERTGVIEEIWPLRPDRLRIRIKRSGAGKLQRWYLYDDDVNGIHAVLPAEQVLHIAGHGFDGVRGYPIVELAANSIGLGLATEHHGGKVFSNGSAPGGALTVQGNLSPEARRRMADDWEDIHRGIDRSHRVAILEEGVTWQQVGMPNDSAQFLETRKLQVTEMARWLRLPPHKIGDLERSTFSNIEQQQLDYVSSALNIWLVRWEQAIFTQLLLPEERERYFAEHLVDALLRGDTAARYAAYAIGRNWGWLSANDVREMENQNPVEGGDAYLVPLNMVPAGAPALPPAQDDDARAAARRARMMRGRGALLRGRIGEQYAPLIADVDRKVAELEQREVGDLVDRYLTDRAGRSISTFVAEIGELYNGSILAQMTAWWLPLFTQFAADIAEDAAEEVGHPDGVDLTTWVQAYVAAHTAYRKASALGQLSKLANNSASQQDAATAITERLLKWTTERPEQTARWESNQMSNAAAREAWKEAGVRQVKWVTVGSEHCPYCKKLDGAVKDISDPFVAKGDQVDGDEDGQELVAKRDTFHPPVHAGCRCQVVPVV